MRWSCKKGAFLTCKCLYILEHPPFWLAFDIWGSNRARANRVHGSVQRIRETGESTRKEYIWNATTKRVHTAAVISFLQWSLHYLHNQMATYCPLLYMKFISAVLYFCNFHSLAFSIDRVALQIGRPWFMESGLTLLQTNSFRNQFIQSEYSLHDCFSCCLYTILKIKKPWRKKRRDLFRKQRSLSPEVNF